VVLEINLLHFNFHFSGFSVVPVENK